MQEQGTTRGTAVDISASPSLDKESGNLANFYDLNKASIFPPWLDSFFLAVPGFRKITSRKLLTRLLWVLVPSFLQGQHHCKWARTEKLHPTAYLDGMRGLGALAVFFCHYSYQCFFIAESYGCGDNNWSWLKLPILRLFYQGQPAVCIFFVISGYVLSYRPLKLMRSRKPLELFEALSSLVFRRAFRLFLPAILSSFIVLCLVRLGAYDLTREFANDTRYMKNIIEPHPQRLGSTMEQFREWLWSLYSWAHIFSWDPDAGRIKYDVHLWAIPVEYLSSMFLFLVLMATARLNTFFRFTTVISLALFIYRSSKWEVLLFLGGMLIAELDLMSGKHKAVSLGLSPDTPKRSAQPLHWARRVFWGALSGLALYLLSQPDANGHITPGWVFLESLIPSWWSVSSFHYWQSVGAVLFVLAIGHSSSWQAVFNSSVPQYLGKISFAVYLMHGPAMHAVGYHFETLAYKLTGVEGLWLNAGFCLHACFCIPTVIWWADVFWRVVDIPCVKLAKLLERKCTTMT